MQKKALLPVLCPVFLLEVFLEGKEQHEGISDTCT